MIYKCQNSSYNFCQINKTELRLNNDNVYECPACGWIFDPNIGKKQESKNEVEKHFPIGGKIYSVAPKGWK